MKTFITSSSLAILSAVVFAWFLVQTGEELPRRSPDSYPPLGTAPTPPIPGGAEPGAEVTGDMTAEGGESREIDPIAPVEEEAVTEEAGSIAEVAEEEVTMAPVGIEPEPFYAEEMGPPAPALPFVLNINAAEEGVLLQGSIPTREMKVAVLDSIGAVFEEEEIDSRLKFSPDTRSGLWISYLPDFLERFFRYTGGMQEVTVVDGTLILTGAVATQDAKKTLLKWAGPLGNRGLEIRDQVDVDKALGSSLEEIPTELAESFPARFCPFRKERIKEAPGEKEPLPVVEKVALTEEESDPVVGGPVAEKPGESEEELVFLAPFEEQYAVHTVPDLREPGPVPANESSGSAASGTGIEAESAEPESKEPGTAPLVDDGKPLIFEFESSTGDILAEDQPKIGFAVERAQRPRSIIYITGYSDYRGDFEANQKLALVRANRIRDLIFENDLAENVTAEVKTRGDTLSRKRPGKETAEQLSRARRVVVEVYHLR